MAEVRFDELTEDQKEDVLRKVRDEMFIIDASGRIQDLENQLVLHRKRAATYFQVLISVLFSVVLGILANVLGPSITLLYQTYVVPVAERFWLNVVGIIVIFLFGFSLYWFKRKAKLVYGIVEVAFALVAGWQGVTKTSESGISEAVALIASVYFVVRGMDNIYVGLDERREILRIANLSKFAKDEE